MHESLLNSYAPLKRKRKLRESWWNRCNFLVTNTQCSKNNSWNCWAWHYKVQRASWLQRSSTLMKASKDLNNFHPNLNQLKLGSWWESVVKRKRHLQLSPSFEHGASTLPERLFQPDLEQFVLLVFVWKYQVFAVIQHKNTELRTRDNLTGEQYLSFFSSIFSLLLCSAIFWASWNSNL